jgi:lipopolysaccharide core heptose(I) kinase
MPAKPPQSTAQTSIAVPRRSGSPAETLADARPSAEPHRIWVDPRDKEALARAGLATFDEMMATTDGQLLRALPDRENWRLELHEAQGGPRRAYLKKHHTRTWGQWLRAKLGAGAGATPGRVEAENIEGLARRGIPAMRLVAWGEKLHRDGLLESFVLTDELAGYTQLDHYLPVRFAPRSQDRPQARDRDLDRLTCQVAALARRFHECGYNHRDLYCCHFFIREDSQGEFHVHLIDLQRVQHRRRFRRRWIVKDLAQLAYSAPRDRISCTQKMRFIKAYLDVLKLRPIDKRLIRDVLLKKWFMERKLGVKA